MTRIYLVYSRPMGTEASRATCVCDTTDAGRAMEAHRKARADGLVADIKFIDVPNEELA